MPKICQSRAKIVYISKAFVFNCFIDRVDVGDVLTRVSFAPGVIPNDVRVCEVEYDYQRQAFGMILESEEWPVVPDGNQLQEIVPDGYQRIVIEDIAQVRVSEPVKSWRDLPSLI